MAMRENLRNIEAVQNTALTLQKQKEAEKLKKQQEKQALQELEYDVKELIKTEFKKYIFTTGSNYASNFYLLERKEEILKDILEQYTDLKGYTYKKYTIIEIFEKNYYKILKDITKQKLEDEKARFWQQVEETEQNPIKKEFNILPIFKMIACIIFLPILFLAAILFGAMKNQK